MVPAEKEEQAAATTNSEEQKSSFFLYPGNGGPWQCGLCEHLNFDLRKRCLKCGKGIRPPFRSNKPWPCTEYKCCYYINSHETGSCEICGTEKFDPSKYTSTPLEKTQQQEEGGNDEIQQCEVMAMYKQKMEEKDEN